MTHKGDWVELARDLGEKSGAWDIKEDKVLYFPKNAQRAGQI